MATKPKKPGDGSRARYGKCIPRGDAFLPGVDTDVLRKMYKELSGRKDMGKEAHIFAAAIKWREGLGVSEITRQLLQPRSTIHDWLVRLRDRGLEGISDRTAPNHKPILGDIHWVVIGVWLSHAPQAYGFESGLWQASMLRKMILDRLGIDIRPRTLRATLRRMRLSFRTPREVPHKSADPETCKKFTEDTQKRMDALAGAGYTNFYADEMTMLLAALTGRGWLRTRRTRDDQDHLLQEVAEGIWCPGQGRAAYNAGPLHQVQGVQGLLGGAPPKVRQGRVRYGQRQVPQVEAHPGLPEVGRRRRVSWYACPRTPRS